MGVTSAATRPRAAARWCIHNVINYSARVNLGSVHPAARLPGGAGPLQRVTLPTSGCGGNGSAAGEEQEINPHQRHQEVEGGPTAAPTVTWDHQQFVEFQLMTSVVVPGSRSETNTNVFISGEKFTRLSRQPVFSITRMYGICREFVPGRLEPTSDLWIFPSHVIGHVTVVHQSSFEAAVHRSCCSDEVVSALVTTNSKLSTRTSTFTAPCTITRSEI